LGKEMLPKNTSKVLLNNGYLEILVKKSNYSMEALLDFASRNNPNRSYLFLSKILGKYIPCRPFKMRASYHDLSKNISIQGNTLVLGVSETATGLGAGIADEIRKDKNHQIFYSQTTRYKFNKPLAFTITEKHSHAPQHLIYDIAENIDITNINDVVIVDDEISTGKTLSQITTGICKYLPNVKTIHWASLVSWISEFEIDEFIKKHSDINLKFHNLLHGEFYFKRTSNRVINFPKLTAVGLSKAVCCHDAGRTGIKINELNQFECVDINNNLVIIDAFPKNKTYVIIGTSEFTYSPFLFAEAMEKKGYDVLFESTGRSPMLKGGGILSRLKFYDPINEANYYLYNLPKNRIPIIFYERVEHYYQCPLRKKLRCQAMILKE